MDTQRILTFLRGVAANNNRPWFQEHRDEYLACKQDFEQGVAELIREIGKFDPDIANLEARECCYRFYRDIRFSPDKSPYKRHFGAYICSRGRKSLRGGYYIHIQPGQSLICAGCYWLPTNILTSCRNEIMANIDEWRRAVENRPFVNLYGHPGEGYWLDDGTVTPRGFGIGMLKTAPKGFPRDYEYLDYLRMKDYAAWHTVADNFYAGDEWVRKAASDFRVAKPMMDIINSVVDDYL